MTHKTNSVELSEQNWIVRESISASPFDIKD